METVMPDFDRGRVHDSDIKKIIQWYNVLSKHYPVVFEPATEETKEPATEA